MYKQVWRVPWVGAQNGLNAVDREPADRTLPHLTARLEPGLCGRHFTIRAIIAQRADAIGYSVQVALTPKW